jgi:protein-S-isoprenylcysteine O-methyltransferase Ste14
VHLDAPLVDARERCWPFFMSCASGGPGIAVPPNKLVAEGRYRYTRNPMYLGHLIFLLGLAVTFWSWLGLALFLLHVVWFHRRVREDEARLQKPFGAQYADYRARVKWWIPGVI